MITSNNLDQQTKEQTDIELANGLRQTLVQAQASKMVDFAQVAKLAAEIGKVEVRIAKAKKIADREDADDDDASESRDEIKKQMRAELKRRDYHYVTENEKFWLKTSENDWMPVSEKGLTRDIIESSNLNVRNILYDVMKEDGRWFDHCTYTFDKTGPRTLNMLVRDFLTPCDGEAHWFFDMLMRSLGGDRAENHEHIAQLILSKFLHPESVTIPALVLQDGGGTGKALLVEKLLPTIFGKHGVATNLKVENVTGKFNSLGQGKAVWFLNESSRGAYSHSALKALVGSSTYTIEHKGVNPIMGRMTAWIIMSTQDVDGAVMLEGNAADRRWSVVRGKRPLAKIVAEKLDCSDDAAVDWIEAVGVPLLTNRVEAGRWIKTLIDRHGDVSIKLGLHGEDYAGIRDIQKPIERLIFDEVFDDDEFKMIRTSVLYDAYQHYARLSSRTPMARGKFHAQVAEYLREHHPDFFGKCSVNVTGIHKDKTFRSKVEVYSRERTEGSVHTDHTQRYIDADKHGQKQWKFSL